MYKYMDEVEISISAIKNLKMVHFYHISKNDSVLSAAMIQYDSDKMLNLSVLDKHYDEFVSMIFMVYEKEADERSIVADDYTRSILQTMKATDTGYYSRYMSKLELLSKPLYYHQSYMPYIAVPIIKYVIEQLYSIAGKKIFWNPLNSNWFGKGTLAASFENGEKHVFPYVLSNDEIGSYTVDIGNFFENRFFLNMKIRFDKDGIAITAQSDGAGIMCNMNYIIDTEGCELNSHCDIELKGKPVYNENAPIKQVQSIGKESKIAELTEYDENSTSYYELPWGQYIALETKRENDTEAVIKHVRIGYSAFADERNNTFLLSFDEVSAGEEGKPYIVNNYALDIYEEKIFGQDIQVYCEPCRFRSRGFYKDKMADRYFKTVISKETGDK